QDQRRRDEWQEHDDPGVPGEPGADDRRLGYHLRRFTSSTLMVSRLRKIRMTIARPIPTSAAATAMMNSPNTCPVRSRSDAENPIRFTVTAFSISSIDISTRTAFRLASTP